MSRRDASRGGATGRRTHSVMAGTSVLYCASSGGLVCYRPVWPHSSRASACPCLPLFPARLQHCNDGAGATTFTCDGRDTCRSRGTACASCSRNSWTARRCVCWMITERSSAACRPPWLAGPDTSANLRPSCPLPSLLPLSRHDDAGAAVTRCGVGARAAVLLVVPRYIPCSRNDAGAHASVHGAWLPK